MRHILVYAGVSVVLGLTASAHAEIKADVIYGHKDGMALVYDVFTPEAPNGAGVLRMVSGGWHSVWVEPTERLATFEPLLAEGFTVFAVHHGSAPRFKVPDAVSDVRAALRHIRRHAAEYGVDPERLGVWGGSAGGHLSLMLGLHPEGVPSRSGGYRLDLGPHYRARDGRADVAAIVAYYPPVDLRNSVGPNRRFPALDFARDAAEAVSPILFVTRDDPPTLLIHGDADDLVPLNRSEDLAATLEDSGVPHNLIVIKGGDHGFRNPEHRAAAGRAMVAWFKRHLAPRVAN